VSKDALDYKTVNNAISASSQSTYAGKVHEALQSQLGRSIAFNANGDGTFHFKTGGTDNKVVATIVAIDKR